MAWPGPAATQEVMKMAIELRPTPLRTAIMRLGYDQLCRGDNTLASIRDLTPAPADDAYVVHQAIVDLETVEAVAQPSR